MKKYHIHAKMKVFGRLEFCGIRKPFHVLAPILISLFTVKIVGNNKKYIIK